MAKVPAESKFVSRLIQLEIEKAGSAPILIDELTTRIAEQVAETPELAKQCIFYFLRTRVNAKLRAGRGSARRVTVKVDPTQRTGGGWVNVRLEQATLEQKLHKVSRYEAVIKGATSEIQRLEGEETET